MTKQKVDIWAAPTSDGARITEMIQHLMRTAKRAGDMAQIVLASCVMHAVKHGDSGKSNKIATDLVNAMPRTYNVRSLLDYFTVEHDVPGLGKVAVFREENKELRVIRKNVGDLRKWMEANGEAALGSILMKTKHETIKPDKIWNAYDVAGSVLSLLKKLAKDLDDDTKAPKIKNVELATGLLDLLKKNNIDTGDLGVGDLVRPGTVLPFSRATGHTTDVTNTDTASEPEQGATLEQVIASQEAA